MTQEVVEIDEIDSLSIHLLVLDHLHFHVDHTKFIVLDTVIVIENSIQIERHYVQDILNFITNRKTPEILNIFLSEKIAIVLFSDPTLELDITLEIILHHGHMNTNQTCKLFGQTWNCASFIKNRIVILF